ncbi:MAG TPA: hypothetical protein VK835_03295 [Bacteroidia bacterium]|jgi:hypothetical protein|nr:hypothetical protein [Bacteroidia bacterium]
MKKLYYAASLLTLASLSVLTSCKKDTTPFPTKSQSNGNYPDLVYTTPWFPTIADADAIFVSAQVTDEKTVIISPFKNEYEYGMAKLASGTGNFSTLLDGGAITLNDSVLAKSTALSYLSSISNFTLNLSNTARWHKAANGTDTAFTFTSPRVNPTYSYDPALWDSKWAPIYPRTLVAVPAYPFDTIPFPYKHRDSLNYPNLTYKGAVALYKSDSTTHSVDSIYNATVQYTIPIKNYTTNSDSVFIYMTDDKGFVYKRTCLPTVDSAAFRPNDFPTPFYANYDLATFKLQVNAINYQPAIINSKKYYFLKMASAIKYYQPTK